ncbi:MAG: metal ABC transporter ATP-binding protein [Candidatus Kapaibacteriota bacterium]
MEHIAIEIHDLTVSYNRKPVLWGIDCDIPMQEMTAIIGPNGAGKSTLMKAMLGLIPSASGYTKFHGKNIKEVRHIVSYMPQRESVDWDFPITVRQVVMMGRNQAIGLMKRPRQSDILLVSRALEQVGLESFADRQISELSGGQQQRVFLARALVQDAEIFLMDEPFAGVDTATEEMILDTLKSMKASGKTLIVIHHDLLSVSKHFDNALLLNLRKIAFGKTGDVLNDDILQETYGGKLSILSDVGQLLAMQQRNTRKG